MKNVYWKLILGCLTPFLFVGCAHTNKWDVLAESERNKGQMMVAFAEAQVAKYEYLQVVEAGRQTADTGGASVTLNEDGSVASVDFRNPRNLGSPASVQMQDGSRGPSPAFEQLLAVSLRPPVIPDGWGSQLLRGFGAGALELVRSGLPVAGQVLLNRDSERGLSLRHEASMVAQLAMRESDNAAQTAQELAMFGTFSGLGDNLAGLGMAGFSTMENTSIAGFGSLQAVSEQGFRSMEANGTEWARAQTDMEYRQSSMWTDIFETWATHYKNNTTTTTTNTSNSSSSSSSSSTPYYPSVRP